MNNNTKSINYVKDKNSNTQSALVLNYTNSNISFMKTFPERLQALMDKYGDTQDSLAKAIGCSQGTIGHYLNDRRFPRKNVLAKIAKRYKTQESWLLYGDEEQARLPAIFEIKENKNDYSAHPISKTFSKTFPFFDWQYIDLFVKIPATLSFPHEPFTVYLSENKKISNESFVLRVMGDTMVSKEFPEDSLHDGDFVVIDQKRPPSSFDIVLARMESGYKLRQYVQHEDQIELRPLNKEYKSVTFTKNMQIIGVVAQVVRFK